MVGGQLKIVHVWGRTARWRESLPKCGKARNMT